MRMREQEFLNKVIYDQSNCRNRGNNRDKWSVECCEPKRLNNVTVLLCEVWLWEFIEFVSLELSVNKQTRPQKNESLNSADNLKVLEKEYCYIWSDSIENHDLSNGVCQAILQCRFTVVGQHVGSYNKNSSVQKLLNDQLKC